jgi:hypothetical protein
VAVVLDETYTYLVLHGGMDGDLPVSAEVWGAVRLEAWRAWLLATESSPIVASLPFTANLYDADPIEALRAEDTELADRVDALLHHRYVTMASATPGRVHWAVRWTDNGYEMQPPASS